MGRETLQGEGGLQTGDPDDSRKKKYFSFRGALIPSMQKNDIYFWPLSATSLPPGRCIVRYYNSATGGYVSPPMIVFLFRFSDGTTRSHVEIVYYIYSL